MPEKLDPKEILIIKQLILYPEIVEQSLKSLSPAIISNYIYELVKRFNSFYQNISILGAESVITKNFRLMLLKNVAKNLNNSCSLLGIKFTTKDVKKKPPIWRFFFKNSIWLFRLNC